MTYMAKMQIAQTGRRLLSISILFALSFALMISCAETSSKTESDTTDDVSSALQVVEKSNFDASAYSGPDFTLATSDGSTMTFTDFLGRGKPVVVNFWGTWCPPCRREMPEFVRIYEEYQSQGLQLVGIALRDTPDKINSYTSQNGINWPMVIGNLETAKAFGNINAVPTTIFFDSQGSELSRNVGPISYDKFKEQIESALLHENEIASL